MTESPQLDLLATDARRPENVNPCVRLFGIGPADTTCAGCAHLWCHQRSKRYYKCGLRRSSHGPATDHKVRWPACAKFEERKA